MRHLFTALVLMVLAMPAMAAEKETSAKAGAPGTNVDMPFLMAPLTDADGKLSGYAYISSRLTATSDAGASWVRDKIAFIQDAFVRDVNAAADRHLRRSGDRGQCRRLQARLLADARQVMGAGKVASIAIIAGPDRAAASRAPSPPSPGSPPADSPPAAPAKPAQSRLNPQKIVICGGTAVA